VRHRRPNIMTTEIGGGSGSLNIELLTHLLGVLVPTVTFDHQLYGTSIVV